MRLGGKREYFASSTYPSQCKESMCNYLDNSPDRVKANVKFATAAGTIGGAGPTMQCLNRRQQKQGNSRN